MRKSKVHYATYEAPHEGDNCEYWSNAACGPEYENVTQHEDMVSCMHCLRILKKDKASNSKGPADANDEVWRTVVGYEGKYMVSNIGRVKSLVSNCILNQYDRNGYPHVGLYKNLKTKSLKVHRLVAVAFVGNPDNKPFVNHKDGTRNNNHVENLEWVTNQENRQHGIDLKGYEFTDARKAAVKKINLIARKPVFCVEDNLRFESGRAAAAYYGIHYHTVSRNLDKNKTTKKGKTFTTVEKTELNGK